MYVHNVGDVVTFVRRDDRSFGVAGRFIGGGVAEGGRSGSSNSGVTAVALSRSEVDVILL